MTHLETTLLAALKDTLQCLENWMEIADEEDRREYDDEAVRKPIRTEGGLRKSFKTACDDAEVPFGRNAQNGITFHDIRRTVKTNMLNAGVDRVHRNMILGHALEGMDVHYLVGTDEALKGAMNKFTEWMDTQIEAAEAKLKPKSERIQKVQ